MENDSKLNVSSLIEASNNITGSFTKLKFVTLTSVAGMVICAIVCVFLSLNKISGMNDQIYVLDNGSISSASRQGIGLTRADEIKDQAFRLHYYLFSVSPNRDVVQHNLEEALIISDKSVYNYYKDVDETGFYRRISQNGAVQDIVIDSVRTDVRQYPYPVVTYATLTMTRASKMSRYSLVSRCNMLEVARNPKNLHGLQIEKFEVLDNRLIEERNR